VFCKLFPFRPLPRIMSKHSFFCFVFESNLYSVLLEEGTKFRFFGCFSGAMNKRLPLVTFFVNPDTFFFPFFFRFCVPHLFLGNSLMVSYGVVFLPLDQKIAFFTRLGPCGAEEFVDPLPAFFAKILVQGDSLPQLRSKQLFFFMVDLNEGALSRQG